MTNFDMNPVDFWNINRTWDETLLGVKGIKVLDEQLVEIKCKVGKVTIPILQDTLTIPPEADIPVQKGIALTKFMALALFQFKGNYKAAMADIEYNHLNRDVPYIRVGTDYFKVINKSDRYGLNRSIIKGWRKEEIKQDCGGADILKSVHLFDDFCIEPDNLDYQLSHNNCYNVYAPFSHKPYHRQVKETDIQVSMKLMGHIFGNQLEHGVKYMKVLYEMPRQKLPVLCLVSSERQTGKTTFINWISMIFGDNFTLINPEDLASNFNSSYATKNIISIDETVLDKAHAIEKLKSIATANSMSVNQKFVANYSLPFFGKVIICTNKEKDFMKIDEEEIRFWIRRISSIQAINTNIENELRDEIPKFLKYLMQEPKVDTSRSRMVFTPDEIHNEHLESVKVESYSGLRKDLMIYLQDHFNENQEATEMFATSSDIKMKWFERDSRITPHYITKVIKDEMGVNVCKNTAYVPLNGDPMIKKHGRAFHFLRKNYVE